MKPRDIKNDNRLSGYDYVHFSVERGRHRPKPYQAKLKGGKVWYGPRRATALEAALDYCNYVDAGWSQPQPKLKGAGHLTVPTVDKQVSDKRALAYQLLKEASIEENTDLTGYVYCISDGTAMKIGMSVGHPQNRLKSLQTGNPRLLELLAFKQVSDRVAAEVELHLKYQKSNILGEWFEYDKRILKEFK